MKSKNIQKIISIISLIGFIICTVLLLYPVASDYWNRYRDSKLISNYNRIVEDMDNTETYDELINTAIEYNQYLKSQNRNIVTDVAYDPDSYYESLLNITDIMGYVEIPKINITEPIYHYSHEVSLGKGIGHIHGSSLPVGGINTHCILTGHRGLPNQKFFSDLDKMNIDDRFYIHILNKILVYKVYDIKVIEPTDVESLFIEDNRDLCTLVTCTPYGINTQRLLIMGERVDENKTIEIDNNGHVTVEKHSIIIDPAIWVFFGFVIFIVILFVFNIFLINKKKGGIKNDEKT